MLYATLLLDTCDAIDLVHERIMSDSVDERFRECHEKLPPVSVERRETLQTVIYPFNVFGKTKATNILRLEFSV